MADAKAQSLTAKMDQEMTKIREKYADQLAELNETKDRTFDVMQTYATENKDTLFSKRKVWNRHTVSSDSAQVTRN